MAGNTEDITGLLQELASGNESAAERLFPRVYQELRGLAGSLFARERAGHTLQATAVVHEAYLKLVDQKRATFDNRRHFFAVAAGAMRRLLIDHARSRGRAKRGGGERAVELEDYHGSVAAIDVDVLALDHALAQLAAENERQAQVVELRFFGGLSVEEIAEQLKISPKTVKRDWATARERLADLLGAQEDLTLGAEQMAGNGLLVLEVIEPAARAGEHVVLDPEMRLGSGEEVDIRFEQATAELKLTVDGEVLTVEGSDGSETLRPGDLLEVAPGISLRVKLYAAPE